MAKERLLSIGGVYVVPQPPDLPADMPADMPLVLHATAMIVSVILFAVFFDAVPGLLRLSFFSGLVPGDCSAAITAENGKSSCTAL